MDLPASTGMRGSSAEIAEQAVGDAVRGLCRGGSWLGLVRELGWGAMTGGGRDESSLDALCALADARLGSTVDDAVWAAEQAALQGWHEYLEAHPGDEANALVAASLDASEEAARRMAEAYARILDSLISDSLAFGGRRSEPSRRRPRLSLRRQRPPDTLAA